LSGVSKGGKKRRRGKEVNDRVSLRGQRLSSRTAHKKGKPAKGGKGKQMGVVPEGLDPEGPYTQMHGGGKKKMKRG